MRRTLAAIGSLLLFVCACAGTGVRELRSTRGGRIFEARCKTSPGPCIADARATCRDGYALLDSDSHAGGLLFDAMPGPVTWYAMTFRCDPVAGSPHPEFRFRGRAYTPPHQDHRAQVVSEGRRCSNDFSCGYGHYCVKEQFQLEGVCAQTVNRFGTPTYAPPRSESFAPGGAGECSFDIDCAIGFQCVKGSGLTGHCMK